MTGTHSAALNHALVVGPSSSRTSPRAGSCAPRGWPSSDETESCNAVARSFVGCYASFLRQELCGRSAAALGEGIAENGRKAEEVAGTNPLSWG